MAVEVLMSRGVPEERILFLNLIASPEGIGNFAIKFPKLRVVTAFIDQVCIPLSTIILKMSTNSSSTGSRLKEVSNVVKSNPSLTNHNLVTLSLDWATLGTGSTPCSDSRIVPCANTAIWKYCSTGTWKNLYYVSIPAIIICQGPKSDRVLLGRSWS
jgi:hypothetical protein